MHGNNRFWHSHLGARVGGIRHRRDHVATEHESAGRRVDEHRDRCFPAEGGEHEGAVPMPRRRDHQHRRCGIGAQGPADRDVDEQDADRQVLDALRHVRSEDLRREHQGRDRHRCRLGDERTEQRHCGQAQPSSGQRRGQGHCARRHAHPPDHGHQHRPRSRNHHHHKDEQRFGVVARLRISQRTGPAACQSHCEDEHDGPEPEDDLDLAGEVEQTCVLGVALGEALELFGSEGVDKRHSEDDGRGDLHRRVLRRAHGRP